jgi:hypothetical protein
MACQVISLTVGTDISFSKCSKVAIWSSSGTQYFEGSLHKFLDDSALVNWKSLMEYNKILMWQRSEIAPDEAKYSMMAKLLQFGTHIFVHTHADFYHLTISYWNPDAKKNMYVQIRRDPLFELNKPQPWCNNSTCLLIPSPGGSVLNSILLLCCI